MRFLKFVALAALFAIPVSSADADVYGSSLLKSFNVQVLKDGAAVDPATINFSSDNTVSQTRADLGAASADDIQPSQDALHSVVGTDPTGGGENVFTQLAGGQTNFARGDTFGGGDLITGDSFTDVIAEVETLLEQGGGALGDVAGNVIFRFITSVSGNYSLQYSGLVSQYASAIAPPANVGVRLRTQYGIQLLTGVQDNDINLVDANLSNTQDVVGGNYAYSASVTNQETNEVFLEGGVLYTVQIVQLSEVALFAVPEPGTFFGFMGLAAVGLVRRRQRKS